MGRLPSYISKCTGAGCRKRKRCWRYLKPWGKTEKWERVPPKRVKNCTDFIKHIID